MSTHFRRQCHVSSAAALAAVPRGPAGCSGNGSGEEGQEVKGGRYCQLGSESASSSPELESLVWPSRRPCGGSSCSLPSPKNGRMVTRREIGAAGVVVFFPVAVGQHIFF